MSITNEKHVSIQQLDKLLKEVVHWEDFALQLPQMTHGKIQEILIENPANIAKQKQALYATWLEVYPSATWDNVLSALEISGYMRKAEQIREMNKSLLED